MISARTTRIEVIRCAKLCLALILHLCCIYCEAMAASDTSGRRDKDYITGKVLSGETEAVIPNASVFISNTSKGTITTVNGTFELKGIPAGKYDLIISSVGYTTQVYSFSSEQLPLQLKVYLEPKAAELDAVIVEPYEKNGWQKWGAFFTESFIGSSAAGRLCKIRNYKSLRFRHSKKKNTLSVIADEPLVIENRELGYKLTYQLEEFKYDFNKNSLFYLGYTLFEDMAKDTQRIPKRFLRERRNAYNGSIVHFIRSLYSGKLLPTEFEVRRMVRTPNSEKERVRLIVRKRNYSADSSVYYQNVLSQDDYKDAYAANTLTADSLVTENAAGQRVLFFNNYIQVTYKGGLEDPAYLANLHENRSPYHPRSLVFLASGIPVVIDSNGNCNPPTEFFSSGYWGWSEKISHLLPSEYDNTKGR